MTATRREATAVQLPASENRGGVVLVLRLCVVMPFVGTESNKPEKVVMMAIRCPWTDVRPLVRMNRAAAFMTHKGSRHQPSVPARPPAAMGSCSKALSNATTATSLTETVVLARAKRKMGTPASQPMTTLPQASIYLSSFATFRVGAMGLVIRTSATIAATNKRASCSRYWMRTANPCTREPTVYPST